MALRDLLFKNINVCIYCSIISCPLFFWNSLIDSTQSTTSHVLSNVSSFLGFFLFGFAFFNFFESENIFSKFVSTNLLFECFINVFAN